VVFNSLTFIVFFACVLGLHSLPLSWTTKKINLLIASYLFYAAWNPPFVILLWISTVVDWYAAQGLVEARRQTARHAWMLLSVIANLGMLGYFKYGQFLLDNFTAVMGTLGIAYHPAHYDIVLPVGISFYTFATMSYTLDVYLRRALPAQNLLDYALFVTFFPHLVAGPIMRPTELVPQFAQPRRASAAQLRFGLALMTLGLFNKVVLADSFLSRAAERVYDGDQIPGTLDAWMGTLAFSGQIFCDFAGYSTTAIGAALCLGFAMPDNFRFPYAAVGFSDFWRRWHITLSSWLRDYLYIPLGGNRGTNLRTYRNLVTVFVLCGVWHGANWTFVLWGFWHGAFLVLERLGLKRRLARVPAWTRWLYALLAVMGGWVLFRAADLAGALDYYASLVGLNGVGDISFDMHDALGERAIVTLAIGCALAVLPRWAPRLSAPLIVRAATDAGWTFALLVFSMITVASGAYSPFLYFKF
jgi:alginate O-acetyltransferase complex protein AlgI